MNNRITFKELVMSADIQLVLNTIIRLYPTQVDMLDNYAKVLTFLLEATPINNENNLYITISEEAYRCMECENCMAEPMLACTEVDDNRYYSVSGWYDDGTDVHYCIEYNLWDTWLGYYIHDDTLNNFTKEEIIVHCMWEMTFISFDQKKITEACDYLSEICDGLDNGTVKTVSWEEVKKSLLQGED